MFTQQRHRMKQNIDPRLGGVLQSFSFTTSHSTGMKKRDECQSEALVTSVIPKCTSLLAAWNNHYGEKSIQFDSRPLFTNKWAPNFTENGHHESGCIKRRQHVTRTQSTAHDGESAIRWDITYCQYPFYTWMVLLTIVSWLLTFVEIIFPLNSPSKSNCGAHSVSTVFCTFAASKV